MADPFELIGAEIEGEAVVAFAESFGHPLRRSGAAHRKTLKVSAVGIEVTADPEGAVHTIDFRVGGGSKLFPGELVYDLKDAKTRAETLHRVGETPKFTSEEHAAWDFEDYRLITMFDGEELVRVVATTRR